VVSILIICMTDAERPYLGEAIASAIDQGDEHEILVAIRSDTSLFDEFRGLFPSVQFVPLLLAPAGLVRNELVRLARGDWVAFLDGDDVWASGKLRKQVEFALHRDLDFVGTDHLLIDENGLVCAFNISVNVAMPSSWLVRRTTMVERPFGDDPVQADVDWWRSNSASLRTGRLAQPLLRYRVRETSLSSTMANKRNKLVTVRLARRPYLRPLVIGATWLINRLRRSERYVWNTRDWGPAPNGADR
jgi:glycosyltransferase involved in cell wall biosynthesis